MFRHRSCIGAAYLISKNHVSLAVYTDMMKMFRELDVFVPLLNGKASHTSDGVGRGFQIAISKTIRKRLLTSQLTDSSLFTCMFDETNNVSKESVCSVFLKFMDKSTHTPTTMFFELSKVLTRKTGISVAG